MENFISDIKKLNDNNHKSQFPELQQSGIEGSSKHNEGICQLIKKSNIQVNTVLDIACGHGNHINALHNAFGSFCIGIDKIEFKEWNKFSNKNIHFIKKDIDNVIHHVNCKEKFDVILTMNTLRGYPKRFPDEYLTTFLDWCKSNSDYLITNNCLGSSGASELAYNTFPNAKKILPAILSRGYELILSHTQTFTHINDKVFDINLFKVIR